MISLAFGLGMAWSVLTVAGRDGEPHDLWLCAMREMCQSDWGARASEVSLWLQRIAPSRSGYATQ